MDKKIARKLYFMKEDTLCTEIVLYYGGRVEFKNFTNKVVDCAFGVRRSPVRMKELDELVKERCFPESRDNCKELLKDYDIDFYDPYAIVKKTHGIMFDDTYWIKFEDDGDLTYKEARKSVGL